MQYVRVHRRAESFENICNISFSVTIIGERTKGRSDMLRKKTLVNSQTIGRVVDFLLIEILLDLKLIYFIRFKYKQYIYYIRCADG